MSFSMGIVGLPNVGKSSLFKALTSQSVEIANYPFATVDPNVGIVEVPDERLDAIQEIILAPKITPTVIEFFDIAGLVRDASKGEGLGNEFLGHIQRVDAILHLIRNFNNEAIEHVEGSTNPERDYEITIEELKAKDRATLSNIRERLETKVEEGDREAQEELELVISLEESIENHKPPKRLEVLSEAQRLGLISIKPELIILNVDEQTSTESRVSSLLINAQQEADAVDLSNEEKLELNITSRIADIIKFSYQTLNLITFFTIKGGEELRAWTLRDGSTASQAGGVIHDDFEKKFISADILSCEELIKADGWKSARQRGLIRTEGKEYVVQDGDIIEFII